MTQVFPTRWPPSTPRRTAGAALLSTVVAFGLLGWLITSTPGWPRVRESFLDVDVAIRSFPLILDGLVLNLTVLLCLVPVVLATGLGLALLRGLRGPAWAPVRIAAMVYVDLFRGVPLIVCLFAIGFGLPTLGLVGVPNDPVVLGGIALGLVYTAYVGEVFRAGIDEVHREQVEASRLDGASAAQSLRLVVLPQAVRAQNPNLLSNFVALQKDCGLISVLGAVDAVRAAQIQAATSFTFTPYVVAALLFVMLSIPSGRLADWLARRSSRAS